MRLLSVLALSSALLLSVPHASAEEPVFCGLPTAADLDMKPVGNSEDGNFCDIHSRRIAYRNEAVKLKDQMQQRAERFAAPRQAAYQNYLEDLEALNEERGTYSE